MLHLTDSVPNTG